MAEKKLISWNVNGIRACIGKGFSEAFAALDADIICLQEVKAKEEDFPFEAVKALGFEHIALYGMAGYNGVAILSKHPLKNPEKRDWVGKQDARHIKVCVFDDIEINDVYIPAGGDIPDPVINLTIALKQCYMDDISEYFEKQ